MAEGSPPPFLGELTEKKGRLFSSYFTLFNGRLSTSGEPLVCTKPPWRRFLMTATSAHAQCCLFSVSGMLFIMVQSSDVMRISLGSTSGLQYTPQPMF
ncbi:hypothetical protein RRG08_007968 [Elysia crispata]|uniref:Uncharacterized protein n=1 Tax=Elysia crispata TaxID=231223 RepID=A0AAE0ZR22_9GAST|nr:hypothetical protein RRG08_007968 [Elysia crispata]